MGSGYSLVAVTQWVVQGKKYYGKEGFQRAAAKWNPKDLDVDLTGQVHIVTGANAGLGRAAAEALAQRKATVHIVCRNAARGEEALLQMKEKTGNPNINLHVVDVADSSAVRAFASKWIESGVPITSLVNNAGVLLQKRETVAGPGGGGAGGGTTLLETGMATALMQTYLLTGLLLPALLLKTSSSSSSSSGPARVINVSSGGGLTVKLDIDDLNCEKRTYDGTIQYAHAKRAQMALTTAWTKRLGELCSNKSSSSSSSRSKGSRPRIIVSSMHPGWATTEGVKTSIKDFYEKNKETMRSTEQGADTIVWLAASQAAGKIESGKFWFDREMWSTDFPLAGTWLSDAEIDKLWNKTAALTGWKYEGSEVEKLVKEGMTKK